MIFNWLSYLRLNLFPHFFKMPKKATKGKQSKGECWTTSFYLKHLRKALLSWVLVRIQGHSNCAVAEQLHHTVQFLFRLWDATNILVSLNFPSWLDNSGQNNIFEGRNVASVAGYVTRALEKTRGAVQTGILRQVHAHCWRECSSCTARVSIQTRRF